MGGGIPWPGWSVYLTGVYGVDGELTQNNKSTRELWFTVPTLTVNQFCVAQGKPLMPAGRKALLVIVSASKIRGTSSVPLDVLGPCVRLVLQALVL